MSLLLWLYSLKSGHVTIIDRYWSAFFVLYALVAMLVGMGDLVNFLVVFSHVIMWGIRLSWHLVLRGPYVGEDKRYIAIAHKYGKSWRLMSLVVVFISQAIIALIIALPITVCTMSQIPFGVNAWLIAGFMLFWCGLIFESIADHQLLTFQRQAKSKGEVLTTGLWSLSRHPNYFGESLVWWGLFFMSVALSGVWWTIVSPVLITYLLLRVSGVFMLEQNLKKTKRHYSDYIGSTNAFFPWPRKKNSRQFLQ